MIEVTDIGDFMSLNGSFPCININKNMWNFSKKFFKKILMNKKYLIFYYIDNNSYIVLEISFYTMIVL